MKKWTRIHTLVAGVVLILATNAVALVGVAYNRSEPESTLKLTERELHLPYSWGFEKENSGIALTLQWRVLAEEDKGFNSWQTNAAGFGGVPDWINKAKLAAQGIDVSKREDTPQGRMYYDKMLPKEVLLVLELDGPAYRSALARARRNLQNEKDLLKANPGKREFEERAKNAAEALDREEHSNSRLFVVDAGRDVAGLRAKYPDRSRYAIVHGQIRPQVIESNHKSELAAYINGLSISEINVPATYRRIFEPLLNSTRTNKYGVAASPFEVTAAFGKRLEPWITEAKASK
ncbi:MAG TPA: DUF4824 family protein [Candidatus Methylomirabilis sp.]|nr:DUF4824 family protein [Candidatus Methylomirabilis sp.]